MQSTVLPFLDLIDRNKDWLVCKPVRVLPLAAVSCLAHTAKRTPCEIRLSAPVKLQTLPFLLKTYFVKGLGVSCCGCPASETQLRIRTTANVSYILSTYACSIVPTGLPPPRKGNMQHLSSETH